MAQTTLDKINSFIDVQAPKLATFLHHQINMQQNAVTYKELREAIHQGQFPLSYIVKWQQDYSKFVVDYYAPFVEKAVTQTTSDLTAIYGVGFHDPQMGFIASFINDHGGKLIREVTETQYKAINMLVRQASMTETMTVDQLARAIRPCVGLTQRQAQYVKNYYDNLIDQGYSQQDALKKQAAYAAKVHRRRAQTIAETEMAFAYNAAADEVVRQNIKDGYIEPDVKKRWLTAADENVCDMCGHINGETVGLDDAFSIGVKLPPAHPRCRCAVAYDNIKVAVPAAPQPGTAGAQPLDPTYQQPTIADAPKFGTMHYTGSQMLGTGEMYQYTDDDGYEWIFKPAQSKQGKPEAFRAYVQEAGYRVQSIVDPDSAIPCGVVSLDTPKGMKLGAAQLRMTDLDPSFDLKAWQHGHGPPPTAEIITQLQRENVTDWLMCNFDSHGGNFLLDGSSACLYGVDKEQAFRYIGDAAAQKMSYTFHPNVKYGETEPIYNTLYRKFAKGEIDIDLNDTLAYIKRVEAIPDAQYREIFRDYAEALHGKGNKAEQLLDQIVGRKKNLRATYETFYSELLTKRKGTQTAFQFIDKAASAATQPLQAVSMSGKALSGMPLSDLQAIAKQKGIKYAWNMNKGQLVDAISDPTKTAQIVADAKARAYAVGTKPKAQKTPAAAPVPKDRKVNGITQLSDAMNDIDGTLAGSTPRGVALISDSTSLEGLETTLRKVEIDGKPYYELSGKMTQSKWLDVTNRLQAQSGTNWHFNVASGKIDYTKPVLELSSSTSTYRIPTKYIRNGDDIIVISGANAQSSGRALMGQFNIRVQASSGADASKRIMALMKQAGIDDIADDVTEAAIDRYKKMRLIWQTDPKLAGTLDAVTSSDAEIDRALTKLGITKQRLDKVQVRKVQDGYFTLYDPENVKLANKYKVAYLYHEASSADAAVSILQSGELLATTNRWGRGIVANGASSSTDIGTGGADSVFTRIVFDNQVGKNRRYCSFGNYVFVFDKKALERTDWYAYRYDEFGTTETGTFFDRYGTEEHFKAARSRYSRSNELMFRKTLPLDTLKEIRVPASQRRGLIDKLRREGITQYNGIRIEDLIKEGDDMV